MPSVLFVCTGNQFRSPVAAACFKRLLTNQAASKEWGVQSAGTWAIEDQPLPLEAVAAAARLGMNLEDHRTRTISEQMLRDFDLIVVMERGQKEAIGLEFPWAGARVHLLAEMSSVQPGDIPDPNSEPADADEILQEVCRLVQHGFARIQQLATDMPEQRAFDNKRQSVPKRD